MTFRKFANGPDSPDVWPSGDGFLKAIMLLRREFLCQATRIFWAKTRILQAKTRILTPRIAKIGGWLRRTPDMLIISVYTRLTRVKYIVMWHWQDAKGGCPRDF